MIADYLIKLQFGIWEPVKNFFLRIWYCHHNARVIEDFEDRMVSVIYEATGGRMSKPYYSREAMLSEIRGNFEKQFDRGYAMAKEDFGVGHE